MRLLVLALTVSGMMSTVLIAPAVPDLLTDLGQSEAMAGVVIGAGTLPGIFTAPVMGVYADLYGRRAVIVPCLAIFGIFGLLAALAQSFWVLVGLRVLQGIAGASLINLGIVLIGDNWAGPARVRMLGRNAAVLTASVALLAPVGGFLTTWGGWRTAFLPYGLALVIAVPAAFLLRSGGLPAGDRSVRRRMADALSRVTEPAIHLPLAIGLAMFVLIFGLVFTVLPLHLEQQFGANADVVGLVIAISGVTATLVAVGAAQVDRLLHFRGVLVLAGVLFACGYPLLGLSPIVALVGLGMLFIGAAEGMLVPSLQTALSARAASGDRGAIMALWGSVVRLGQTIGPLLAGVVMATAGAGPTLWLGGLVLALVILVLARRAVWAVPDQGLLHQGRER